MKLYTVGYSRWSSVQRIDRMLKTLKAASVNTLIDIRHSPCSSQPNSRGRGGTKAWNLQTEGTGIAYHLEKEGIEYVWLGELGNPQKNDKSMIILREHISSKDLKWPVNRGMELLHEIVQEKRKVCCLLCTCKYYEDCHRKVIAETLSNRYFSGKIEICNLR